mmetsp:Transcript_71251/g.225078  ORF Transcript_71251/g.225078 Transcript_71251/m.225078 type:complete len:282 (-) Transcript_71251:29-874(-)
MRPTPAWRRCRSGAARRAALRGGVGRLGLRAGRLRAANPSPLEADLQTLGGLQDPLELLQDELELLPQLLRSRPLAELHGLDPHARGAAARVLAPARRSVQGAAEHVGGVDLHGAVAEGDDVARRPRVELPLDGQEGLGLPPARVFGEGVLKSVPGRDDLHTLQQRHHRWDVLRGAVLGPTAHRVRDDEGVAGSLAGLQKPRRRALDAPEVAGLCLVQVPALQAEERGAEEGVVPVEDDAGVALAVPKLAERRRGGALPAHGGLAVSRGDRAGARVGPLAP